MQSNIYFKSVIIYELSSPIFVNRNNMTSKLLTTPFISTNLLQQDYADLLLLIIHQKLVLILLWSFLILPSTNCINKIDLSGNWNFALDSTDIGINNKWHSIQLNHTIKLPGTTDEAGYGIPNVLETRLEKPQVLRLTRKNSYIGAAWYNRQILIPSDWKNKQIILKLERVIWETRVWVDGIEATGKQESLSTPHYFNLSELLSPGNHTISIRVDNRKKYDISVNEMAHAYTNETQIKWNGILGEISCMAEDKISIKNIQIFPDIENKSTKVRITLNNSTTKKAKSIIEISATLNGTDKKTKTIKIPFTVERKLNTIELNLPIGKNTAFWDEFHPNIYTLTAQINGKGFKSRKTESFGMRSITNKYSRLQINGKSIFLRGTLECAIFPLTGHPPMDKKGWLKVFESAKEWGLNHLRFHSWCPPEAAFEVADEIGFYIQVELPLWSLTVNKSKLVNDFLYSEADKIINEYGNHPSFCFWSIGNELQTDFIFLNSFVDYLKTKDPRHLYTNTSYTFEKGHGDWPEKNDDFFITQTTKKGWVRGQGIFDSERPSFNKDYSASVEGLPVPLITHEIGQYAVYPNINEIEKYTGVLEPLNFKAVKADLTNKGLLGKANSYLMASGKLAALLYKEEIERALKTNGISGFQLLDLHDFPGQGTALVGLLDAFWENKGLVSSEFFRQFSAPVVPLIRFDKATYKNDEQFGASIEIANYGNTALINKKLNWRIANGVNILKNGTLPIPDMIIGSNKQIGKIDLNLADIKVATTLSIHIEIEGTDFQNNWQIWVYPSELLIDNKNIVVTDHATKAIHALNEGKKVLFCPKQSDIIGVEGKFVPVFWSPVHFPNQPGTMGLLIDTKHNAFDHFPTEIHTNWQWWEICKRSKTICIDSIPSAHPIIENVDNFMKNRRLCSIFEAKVGKGKLIFSSMDLISDLENRYVAKQLLFSLIEYMKSEKFSTQTEVEFKQIEMFLLKKMN